ncbi:hypothetical protein F2P79_003237 [Pimephales promelas]|nr:hypothetical protein F2P79_003237 [Pimephales promelas]
MKNHPASAMASTGLLFLMLMSSSFLLYTVTSDDENKLQGEKTLDKAKYIAKEQKWESWASGAYHKPEMNINKAWDMLKTMLHSVKDAKDENEKMRLIEEFMKNYKNHLAKVDEEAKTAYDAASVMFQVHKKCIQNSMDYIQKDVLALIDNKKQRSDIAKEVYSFLVKKYDRQVKGNHTKIDLVKQTIGRCIKDSVSCHEVAQKLSKCTEAMEGKSVTQTYTAVHAYIRKGHASYKTEEEDEIIAATKDQTPPAVYIGKCKKYLGMKTNNFLVLIKSDEEIEKKDLCSKMNCGGKERGKCVKMKDVFLAMCECKMPYYGEDCEESLEDYKKNLKGEIEMEESGSNSVGSGQ